jgi:cytoskeleton protein RodZ
MAFFQRLKSSFVDEAPGRPVEQDGPRLAGAMLRRRREALGLDPADIAAALRIKPAYVSALETGYPDQLPGPAYASGFLRAYADHLGLDHDEVLQRFKQGSAAFARKPDLSFPMPLGERSIPGSGVLLVAIILAICGYGTWYYLSTSETSRPPRVAAVPAALLRPNPEPQATGASSAEAIAAPSTASPPIAVPTATPSTAAPSTAAPSTAEPHENAPGSPDSAGAALAPAATPASSGVRAALLAPTPPVVAPERPETESQDLTERTPLGPAPPSQSLTGPPGASTRIIIRAAADSWIQIRDANRSVLVTRLLKAGESYAVPDRQGLAMRTGNAGGLAIIVDGNPAPPIGPVGGVRRNVALDPQALMAGIAVRD